MTHKVLIAESLDENVLGQYPGKLEFVYKPHITPQALEKEIAQYDGLIVRPKPVSATAINNAASLKLVIRGGAGVNSIALDECKKRGIVVENTPGLNSDATAEFTFHSMLNIIRGQSHSSELRGKTLGIVGYGNIGKRVEKIAMAFGMQVSVFKRGMNLHEFLAQKHDIISLHLPLTDDTRGIIGQGEFALMKPGVIIINTARPYLIDAIAFQHALRQNIVSRFAIDADDDQLPPYQHERGILTPHIADNTGEAMANITHAVLTQAIAFFKDGTEINRVV